MLLASLLAGCGTSAPTAGPTAFPTNTERPELAFTLPPTWTSEPTSMPGPRQTATATPTPTITATPLGINNPYLTNVEALLPEGSRPMRERAWRISGGDGPFWGFMVLPVEMVAEDGDTGQDVALLGLPRGESGGWDRKTIYLMWLWSIEKREPAAWTEIRQLPYAPEQAEPAFLARDAEGNWQVVPLAIGEEVQAGPLLPVADPADVFLAIVDEADEDLFVLRDGTRIAVYDADGPLWEDQPAPGARVTVVRDAPASRVDEASPFELILHWPGENGGTLQFLQRTADGMDLIAETSGRAQFLEIDGDGFREFLLPDDASDPQVWNVLKWDGERYAPGAAMERPEAPTAQVVTDWENLPALPASLYLRGADGRWAVWPKEGAALAEATGEPPDPQPCSRGVICRSPDGRYEITALPAAPTPTPLGTEMPTLAAEPTTSPTAAATTATTQTPASTATPTPETAVSPTVTGTPPATAEPTATPLPRLVSAIRSGGRTVEIPGTLNYAGTSSFAWSSDDLLMGRAGITGGLYRVNPGTGEASPLIETFVCVPGAAECPQASTGMGVISPRALGDDAIGFAVQSTMPGQYPPPGIYRRDADAGGVLTMLADLRLLEPYCVATRAGYDFGQVIWSPDGKAFLYYSPPACLDGIVLLGLADGSTLYDLSNLPAVVTDLRWGE